MGCGRELVRFVVMGFVEWFVSLARELADYCEEDLERVGEG